MKKATCSIFCLAFLFCILPVTTFANDFTDNAISVFKELRKLDEESRAAFMSGDSNFNKEKGELLTSKKEEYNKILKSLPGEYCTDPQQGLLKEFINTLINSTDEYPTYVFAELYACDPDRIIKEILSLPPENKRKISDDLDWGFKNIKYKIESHPDYKELKDKLKNLKNTVRGK